MTLRKFKMPNLGKKLELKNALLEEVQKVDDAIDEMVGEKKSKIKSKGSKKAK